MLKNNVLMFTSGVEKCNGNNILMFLAGVDKCHGNNVAMLLIGVEKFAINLMLFTGVEKYVGNLCYEVTFMNSIVTRVGRANCVLCVEESFSSLKKCDRNVCNMITFKASKNQS